ncbi:MAG: EamA/RhaT family transporter [Candidatus Solibacter sp.]|nr:EamA/RhaT family transporter [Candidatus Solibacter sp.]
MSTRLRAELTLVLIALIWGATFVVVKAALADATTLAFLAIRFSVASLLLFLVFRSRLGAAVPARTSWIGGAVCGAFLFVGYALQTSGLRYTTASNSAFLTGLYVVLVPLFVSIHARRRLGLAVWAACALAFAGTALMTGLGIGAPNRGDLLTIGCAAAFSAHIVAVAHWSGRINYEWLTLLQVAGVAALSLATFWWAETPSIHWTPRLLAALLATAALATALSFSLYTWAQRHTSATRAALLFALEPVFAGLVAWVFAGERWTALSLAGAALILASILLAELKPAPKNENPAP